jgi:hypothetical protein
MASHNHVAGGRGLGEAPRAPKRVLVRLLEGVTDFVQKHTAVVCVLLLLLGLLWVCLFPAVCITSGELKMRGTYLSENSLSTGFERTALSDADVRRAHDRDDVYRSIVARQPTSPPTPDEAATLTTALRDQIAADMRSSGLEVHQQAFGSGVDAGQNVWGILRGVRASGTESIVLAVSFSHFANNSGTDPSGLALLLDFMRKLSKARWVAKDVVLLATSSPLSRRDGLGFGLHKWLQQYHASEADSMVHVGRIRAAIVVDMPGGDYRRLALALPGLNGGLPNMDMFNLWQMSWARHSGGSRGQHRLLPAAGAARDEFSGVLATVEPHLTALLGDDKALPLVLYVERLMNILRFMAQLAFSPSGSHAHFLRYNIDAITLEPAGELGQVLPPAATASTKAATPGDSLAVRATNAQHGGNGNVASGFSSAKLMHCLEDAVHALSNLEERLHQSFYFYFLANEKMFVSIDEYIFSLGVILSPAMVLALRAFAQHSVEVWLGAAFLVTSMLAGAIPVLLMQRTAGGEGEGGPRALDARIEWVRVVAAITSAAVLLVVHPVMARALSAERRRAARVSVRAVVLLVLFYSHMSFGLMNFPLALFSAVGLTPVVVIAAYSGRLRPATCVVCSAAVLLLSPLLWQVIVPLMLPQTNAVDNGDPFRLLAAEWHNFGSMPLAFFGMVVVPLQLTSVSTLWM